MKALILIKVYAEATNSEDAEVLAEELERCIRKISSEVTRTIKPYWKIPEYFEISLKLGPAESPTVAFTRIIEILGGDWEIHGQERGGAWAVWSHESQAQLVFPTIRWANVEVLE